MAAANGTVASDAALMKAYDLGASIAPKIDTADGGQAIIVPDGYSVERLPPLEPPLTHIKQTATLYEIDSFNDYVNRFKTPATRLFAAPGHITGRGAIVQAALDFHEKAGSPGRNHNTAAYQPPYSDEWKRWTTRATKSMQQVEWAEFIEENRRDIRHPDAASLLDLVRRFKATKKQDYDSVAYQPDGSQMIHWTDKTQGAEGTIAVPETLTLGIPVFYRGTVYAVDVFMRYKLTEGQLFFTIKLDRADYVEDAAFTEITSRVAENTAVPVYLGKAS